MEEYDPDELSFSWGKNCFLFFRMTCNFAIAINRIHFAFCKERSDNWNPEKGHSVEEKQQHVSSFFFQNKPVYRKAKGKKSYESIRK